MMGFLHIVSHWDGASGLLLGVEGAAVSTALL